MSTLLKAKCAYLTGNGKEKGAFHFSLVAAYETSENESIFYRKFNIIFYPRRADLRLENLNIDLSELKKGRKDSFIVPNCPYSKEQMLFILPNIRKVAANYDELKFCEGKDGKPKEDKHFTDKDSGQYFCIESRFVVERDFLNFTAAHGDKAILLVDEGKDLF